jgi:spermidine/putrescine transport system permease protein
VFQDGLLWEGTLNSLLIATATTVISTAVGTVAAYSLWKKKAPILTTSLYLSLVTPEILTGVSLLLLFQLLFRAVHLRLGMHTVVLAHVSFSLVYVVLVVLSRLRYFDRDLEDAALDLGATAWGTFRHVTLPLLAPAVLAAALLCFTVSFDDYVITSLVAGIDSQTLPMLIYAMARKGVSPEVNALSVLITIALGTLILIANRLEQRSTAKLKA